MGGGGVTRGQAPPQSLPWGEARSPGPRDRRLQTHTTWTPSPRSNLLGTRWAWGQRESDKDQVGGHAGTPGKQTMSLLIV